MMIAAGITSHYAPVATATIDDGETDGDRITRFAASLKTGSVLRHHVAGDVGREVAA